MFVVYHVKSTMEQKRYKHHGHARNYAAKLNVARAEGRHEYAVATVEYYNTKVVKMVECFNLMTGKKYLEPSNTPSYMSPACESYWSM
jgi:hypothetical protein